MMHMKIGYFEKIDPDNVATFVLGTLVAGLSGAIVVLLYLPVR